MSFCQPATLRWFLPPPSAQEMADLRLQSLQYFTAGKDQPCKATNLEKNMTKSKGYDKILWWVQLHSFNGMQVNARIHVLI
jgi:copper oxidase (laccase) domain-containing protein